jgi:NAD(P)-dependent dehydrogenase (short-subunit alcohol dehydrogenase family)
MSEVRPGAAVISGGGSGLGRELALEVARRGHPIVLLGRREGYLRQVLDLAGGDGLALACDVRDPEAVERAVREVELRWGAAEVVVPAAGVAAIAPLDETAPEVFSRTIATNLTGAFLLIRAFLPGMKRRRRGWIVPLLSVAARQGFAGWSAYCASKWGLAGLVAALREEVKGSGVRVAALYPGATDTPIWDSLPGDWKRPAMVRPEEIARALAFILDAGPSATVEEVHVGPVGGAL